jgi:hypothetical protein
LQNNWRPFFRVISAGLDHIVAALPMMAIAATMALIGFLLLPWMHQIDTKPTSITSMHTASADTLVEDLVSERSLEPVINKNELAIKVGYDLKYVRLPAWQMGKSGVYKSPKSPPASTPIARFDFVRKGHSAVRDNAFQAAIGRDRPWRVGERDTFEVNYIASRYT